ncbi:pilus assembly protein [Alishewanella sp. d11]|uniref:pilus assembly protein n=1 Tax=Alishewanella sp. d11 TaxID=3414030 RepID=UPI003BF83F4A
MRTLIKKIVWCCFGMSMGISVAVSANTLAIPNVPLQTGSDVPANILFLIDDSGSMNFEFMPDDIHYAWRAPRRCTSRDSQGRCISDTRTGQDVEYPWYYSAKVNSAYYDPTVTYQIPVNSSGQLLDAPTYTNAWMDGFNKTSLRNLSNSFAVNFHELSSDFRFINDSGTITFFEGGFYYRFAPSTANESSCNNNPRQAQCYQYVSMNNASAAQKTNFAIWYSYYRNRLLLARSGIGSAFNTLPDNVRVGYGALNTSPKIQRGVREFSGTGRSGFYNWLYGKTASGGTPLRSTLKAAGDYFSTPEPYRVNPALEGSTLVSCRQNFTILMTDGAWNGTSPGVGDSDKDGKENTLADVAHYYYTTDLMNLTNNVPRRKQESPDWQHMVTFGVGLGVDGTEDPAVASKWAPNDSRWPDPFSGTDTSLKKIDDLLHASVNSDGGFFSAKDPQTFSTQLAEALKGILNRVASASNLAATTTSLLEDNSVFQASFNTANWSGNLVSFNATTLTQQWSANFGPWADRPIFTSRTASGATTTVPFRWENLNTTERTALESQDIVDYLRGDRSKEKPNGSLRSRVSLLGDIAHSSPVYVGAPQNRNFQRYAWDGANKYAAFLAAQKDRAPVVYVGANAGMLHGFNADPASSTAGREIFAYVPQRMLTSSAQLSSFAKETYAHRFYVDGSPTVADVYINNQWRTVLVSSLGRGGNSVFALDVTNPTNITLLWDLTLPELGIMTAKPVITRLNNGRWAAVMPYGYNNSSGKNGLLVIDIQNGGTPIKLELPTTAGALGQPEGWDSNRNGNTDWFFAGDLKGNVWKFDLASTSVSSWGLAYNNAPLFTARDAANKVQPITGGISLSSHPQTGQLWLFFGTGKYLETGDSLNNDKQSWYGIVDGAPISSRGSLVQRTMSNVTYSKGDVTEQTRLISAATSNDMVGKKGWYMDLIDNRERITSRARVVGSNLIINTIIPDSDLCNPQGDGWVMAVDPFSGSRLKYHLFDLSQDGSFDDADGITSGNGDVQTTDVLSGLKFEGMPGEPVFVGEQMVVGDSRVAIDSRTVNLQLRRGRISWREVIN